MFACLETFSKTFYSLNTNFYIYGLKFLTKKYTYVIDLIPSTMGVGCNRDLHFKLIDLVDPKSYRKVSTTFINRGLHKVE
jgi:hypothetical protein